MLCARCLRRFTKPRAATPSEATYPSGTVTYWRQHCAKAKHPTERIFGLFQLCHVPEHPTERIFGLFPLCRVLEHPSERIFGLFPLCRVPEHYCTTKKSSQYDCSFITKTEGNDNQRVSNVCSKKLKVKDGSKKEVFQPHLPVRLPCYDLAPVTGFALGRSLRSRTSGTPSFHGLTGGVYKARERIHRAMADARLLANPASWSRVADSSPN